MTRWGLAFSFLLCPAALAAQAPQPVTAMPTPKTQLERGAYLVTIGGCHDCHTPLKMGPNGPEPDMAKMLSGHPAGLELGPPPRPQGEWIMAFSSTATAAAGPWGISYAHNLTPDPKTGMPSKGWTEERFIRAMRNGQHLGGGRPIMPPMPWQGIGRMTDDDLKAMYAFLKTIPPVENAVPETVVAPPPGAPR
jgi:hypothetical protein